MKMREMNDWKISNDTLKLGVELGRGSFGIVMRAAGVPRARAAAAARASRTPRAGPPSGDTRPWR
jgi:hypothetical protein